MDALLYSTLRPDQAGGHVDTTRHVRANDDFKNTHHAKSYETRGEYNSDSVHRNEAFIEAGKKEKAEYKAGNGRPDYAIGQPITANQKPNLDHVISGKNIHEDRARASLTPFLETGDLAAHEANLFYTSETINKAKGKKSPQEFAQYCETKQPEWGETVNRLEKKSQNSSLTDKERKELKKSKELLKADPQKIREEGENAQKPLNQKIDKHYYTSKDFWKTSGVSALKGGGMMALKQGTGLVLLAGLEEISLEYPALLQKWKNSSDGLLEKIKAAYTHLKNALSRAFSKLKENAGDLLKKIFQSFGAGVLSDITTIIIDIFTGTLKSLMRMIRNLWSTVIEAIKILTLNPDNLTPEKKTEAVLKILAVGIGAVLQPILAEIISKFTGLSGVPVVGTVLTEFLGAAVGGIISVTLLHFIENSAIARKIISVITKAEQLTFEVCKQIGNIISVDPEYLWGSRQALLLASGSVFLFGPIGFAGVVGGQMMLAPLHKKLDGLKGGQENILASLSNHSEDFQLFKEKSYKYFDLLVEGQKRQYQALTNLHQEMIKGFEKTQSAIENIPEKTIQLFAEYHLQDQMDRLTSSLKDIEAGLETDKIPKLDLEKTLDLTTDIRGKMEAEWERQLPTSPARFPLLLTAIFALAAEYKARSLLDENLNASLKALGKWKDRAKQEALALVENVSLYELAMERSVLVRQYASAFRAMSMTKNTFNPLNNIPWDDGLDPLRGIFASPLSNKTFHEEWEAFPLITAADRLAWRKFSKLPKGNDEITREDFKKILGLPSQCLISQTQAYEIAVKGAFYLENNQKQLSLSLKDIA